VRQRACLILRGHVKGGEKQPIVTCGDNIAGLQAPSFNTDDLGFITFRGASRVEIDNVVFEGCPLSLQFFGTEEILVKNAEFRHFTEGAVNVFNATKIVVESSTFTNNTAHGVFEDVPYRGQAGGLSIGISRNSRRLRYSITNCTFDGNSGLSDASYRRTTTEVFLSGILTTRGGGLAVLIHESSSIVNISQCTFRDNVAESLGGGSFYAVFGPSRQTHLLNFHDNEFYRNKALFEGGGGAFIGIAASETEANCVRNTFEGNSAQHSGGLQVATAGGLMYSLLVGENKFLRNTATDYGGALALQPNSYFQRIQPQPVFFADNYFEENVIRVPSGGILSCHFFSVTFQGTNTFVGNSGSCLRASSALITVEGRLVFSHNDIVSGGAVYLTSQAQLYVTSLTRMIFYQNEGGFGSAIVVEPLRSVPFLEKVPTNPLCFLLYNNSLSEELTDVIFNFTDNKAFVGPAIYTSNIAQCSDTGFMDFSIESTFRGRQFYYSNNMDRTMDNSSHDIATPVKSIELKTAQVSAFPGETIVLEMSVRDTFNNPTEGFFRAYSLDENDSDAVFNSLAFHYRGSNASVKFTLRHGNGSQNGTRSLLNISIEPLLLSQRREIGESVLQLNVSLCPPGRVLTSSGGRITCDCDSENTHIIRCLADREDIVLMDGIWAMGYEVTSANEKQLFTFSCPPGYCQCHVGALGRGSEQCLSVYRKSDTDAQCVCSRKGYLCGTCVNGTSSTALLHHCESCGPENSVIIVLLVAVDTIVISLLCILPFWKPFNFPSWFYPFLLYIQIVPYVAVDFPAPFEHFHKWLYYLASAIGLYLPYDFCLYPMATTLEMRGLMFTPFILAVLICSAVVVFSWLKSRGKTVYSGVWIVVLLLFTPLMYTSLSVLDCHLVPLADSVQRSVWFYDGSVECFYGGHAALALLAIGSLIICLVMVAASLIVMSSRKGKLRRFRLLKDTLGHPYQPAYYWWFSVDFCRRSMIVAVATLVHNSEVGVLFVVSMWFALYAFVQPYKDKCVLCVDLLLMFNIVLLVLMRSNHFMLDVLQHRYLSFTPSQCGNEQVPTVSSLSVALGVVYYLPLFFALLLLLMGALVKIARFAGLYKQKEIQQENRGTDATFKETYRRNKDVVVVDVFDDMESFENQHSHDD
jgi:hypothetical protein